ncbi:MAG: pyruvate kinase, partial [Bacteroidota bacterium]
MKKKTKIVATISDRNCDVEFLRKMYIEGMDVVRINTAHQDIEATLMVVENVRKISEHIAILIDTKGPEMRTLQMDNMPVEEKDTIFFTGDPLMKGKEGYVVVNYEGFVTDVPVGAKILVDDGDIAFAVKEKIDGHLVCQVLNGGTIKGRKSINVPGVSIKLPTLSEKDRQYVTFAIENDIDFIAHSFVRTKEDVREIQDILDASKSKVKIIAKIENQEGVDNIDEILSCVYGIMIARGDLGIEIPGPKLPAIQKILVRKCMVARKPVIVATQMLHSMIENPRPTRAEINDIANAIYDGTDAIMLSGETAYGRYPVESVSVMAEIAREVESTNKEYRN